jgi:hypothetical protein
MNRGNVCVTVDDTALSTSFLCSVYAEAFEEDIPGQVMLALGYPGNLY